MGQPIHHKNSNNGRPPVTHHSQIIVKCEAYFCRYYCCQTFLCFVYKCMCIVQFDPHESNGMNISYFLYNIYMGIFRIVKFYWMTCSHSKCLNIWQDFSVHFRRCHKSVKGHKILESQLNLKENKNMSTFSVSTVTVDGLAPLGARTSAGKVMTKFGSHIYIYIYIC